MIALLTLKVFKKQEEYLNKIQLLMITEKTSMLHEVKYKYLKDMKDFSKKSLLALHKRDMDKIY